MPKNIEDIIVPERRRSIRDIPIPESRRKNNEYQPPTPLPLRDNFVAPRAEKKISRMFPKSVWMAIGVALLVLIFAALSFFNGATLAYVPKSAALSFDRDVYMARKTTGEDGLLYSVVKLSGDKGLEVSASGEEEVKRKASGTIIIYNTNTNKQKLRATTR